ncbi:MAG: DsbA family protein [Gemmatimonadaceae bacterium]
MGKNRVDAGSGRRAGVVRKQQRKKSLTPFYVALGVVGAIGAGLLIWKTGQDNGETVMAEGSPSQAQGYLYGDPNAPVQIAEFADFECPACGQFATITEPDVRKRIVDAGLANIRFYDFPLPMHRNSMAASTAAACAADQNKFWEMHDRLFLGQPDWSTQSSSNPKSIFRNYARELALNVDTWESCYDGRKHDARILGNLAEGKRLGVNSTPTFMFGRKIVRGALPYDEFKAEVDSAIGAVRQGGSPAR